MSIAVILCLVFGAVLLIYVPPMEDVFLDLSLCSTEDNMITDPADFDSKGWTVYTKDGETVTELTPNGFGGYSGLELGQTFYFSRIMAEELDSPTLQLGAIECTFSVWLDDVLLYTDCPELDNRIGYLTLPMNGWVRNDPILISLPMDYQGKTLTIAQSFPDYTETYSVNAFPTSVRLYCGYSYESGLISESFSTAFLASALFLLGLILLTESVRNRDLGLLCLSLTAFLQMAMRLTGTSFFWNYFGTSDNAVTSVIPLLSAGALFAFLAMRGGKFRGILWGTVGVYLLSVVIDGVILMRSTVIDNPAASFVTGVLPFWLAFFCIVAALVLGTAFWRKENNFYRLFTPLAFAGIVLYWLAAILILERGIVGQQFIITLGSGQITYVYYHTLNGVMIAALVTAVCDAIRLRISRRVEKAAMEERREMLLGSYETMRRQNEEVMMIRHDMAGHFEALKKIADDPEQVTNYLDQLIGQNKKIRSVVQTGNKMLDIILNNKLSAAQDAGIKVEIVKAKAPEKLPLSDTDLCSLVMNVMNNAVSAAGACSADTPYIRLDIHERNNYFALTCENSADINQIAEHEKSQTVPKHGLGLKIIRNITEQYSGLIDTEYDDTSYKIRIAIPLFTA